MTVMAENSIGSLEEQALKRREKLLSLKRKRGANHKGNDDDNKNIEELPKPIFRSYKPVDEKLTENSLPVIPPEDVDSQIKDHLNSAKSHPVVDTLDVTTLAPRKPDWDLKRDVAKKLEKLERQTQRAIAELIRERLKERKDLADIASSASADNM